MAAGEAAVVGRQLRSGSSRFASIGRVAEMAVGGILLVLVLQTVLHFNVLEPNLWNPPPPNAGYWRSFSTGTLRTLGYIAFILPASLAIGFTLGWARVSRYRTVAWPVSIYVEFFRGVPPIVVVLFASILGPQFFPERFQTVELALTLGALAIGLHSAAFQAEIFRAGFQSVSRGQVEAALALGMRSGEAMRHVILPQALRLSLPPLANEFAVVIKDTSFIALIAGMELFHLSDRFGQTLIRQGGDLEWLFAIWTSVAFVYFVMTFAVTRIMRLLERKLHVRGLEGISV